MQDDITPPSPVVPKKDLPRTPPPDDEPEAEPTPPLPAGGTAGPSNSPVRPRRFHRIRNKWAALKGRWQKLGRNTRFAIIAVGLLIFGAGSLGVYSLLHPDANPEIKISKAKTVAPQTVASPLTGVQVTPDQAKRPVTGIIIENGLNARPQSGLQDAGVIFEAIAEGGITRLLTLYQENRPGYIGPVRSLRPYYIDWASAFDAPIAHIGGSPDALAQIRSGGKDLDQFFNAGAYWRERSRPSPHDVYTSFDRLDALNQSKGYTTSKFTAWPRKPDSKLAVPTARIIDVAISSSFYNSHYDYDPATNSYGRSQNSQPHIIITSPDDKVGQQLKPKLLIVLVMSYSIVDNNGHSGYGTNGSGAAYVFQDGGVTQGTWSKADRPSQFEFKDSAGAPLKLNTGQAWVGVVGDASKVTYAP